MLAYFQTLIQIPPPPPPPLLQSGDAWPPSMSRCRPKCSQQLGTWETNSFGQLAALSQLSIKHRTQRLCQRALLSRCLQYTCPCGKVVLLLVSLTEASHEHRDAVMHGLYLSFRDGILYCNLAAPFHSTLRLNGRVIKRGFHPYYHTSVLQRGSCLFMEMKDVRILNQSDNRDGTRTCFGTRRDKNVFFSPSLSTILLNSSCHFRAQIRNTELRI